jgi:hypothetical protein
MGADPTFFRVVVFNCPEEENVPYLAWEPLAAPPRKFFGKVLPHLSVVDLHSLVQCLPVPHLLHIPGGLAPFRINLVFSAVSFEMILHTTIKTFEILGCLKASSGGFSY